MPINAIGTVPKQHTTLESVAGQEIDLRYFVEWRERLWTPAVEFLVQDSNRFAGKTIMDLGCRGGRMACLFGLMGATVVGVELAGVPLQQAWNEAARWDLHDKVSFVSYDGNPATIPGDNYDYIFTKSVLVVVPALEKFLFSLAGKLTTNGELMLAENLSGGSALMLARRLVTYPRYRGLATTFAGVDDRFMTTLKEAFDVIGTRTFFGCVAAVRARRKMTL